jgi:hypothetical protein
MLRPQAARDVWSKRQVRRGAYRELLCNIPNRVDRDYRILALFTDGNTANVAIVIAGIGRGGS